MELTAREHSLVEEWRYVSDPQERLATIVDRARRLPKLPLPQRAPASRVPGCSSSVWLAPELRESRCYFSADADSPVVRGLVALIADFFSGATAAEIVACDADPIELLDLKRTLTPTRQHGLAAVRAAIKAFARSSLGPTVTSAASGPRRTAHE